jgi:hypothetical protein
MAQTLFGSGLGTDQGSPNRYSLNRCAWPLHLKYWRPRFRAGGTDSSHSNRRRGPIGSLL